MQHDKMVILNIWLKIFQLVITLLRIPIERLNYNKKKVKKTDLSNYFGFKFK